MSPSSRQVPDRCGGTRPQVRATGSRARRLITTALTCALVIGCTASGGPATTGTAAAPSPTAIAPSIVIPTATTSPNGPSFDPNASLDVAFDSKIYRPA